MLKQHDLKLIVYAESDLEAQELQQVLNDFIVAKYKQKVYPRAAKISQLIKQYGNNPIINNFIR